MKTFEQFYYKTLLETPMNTGVFESEYSDTSIAMNKYSDVLKNPDAKKVFTLYPDTHPVYLYEEKDGNDIMLSFIPENDRFIYGYATYEEMNDGGIVMTSVYNRPMYVGLAQAVYNRYLIPRYSYLMSNGEHSEKGRKFWRNVVFANLDKNVELVDIDKNKIVQKITDIKELDQYYGDTQGYEKYRIKISK